jgi:hypothetical protein
VSGPGDEDRGHPATLAECREALERAREDQSVERELFTAQLTAARLQGREAMRREEETREVLQRYLNTLFPRAYPQALGARMSPLEAAEFLHDCLGLSPKEAALDEAVTRALRGEGVQAVAKPEPEAPEADEEEGPGSEGEMTEDHLVLLRALGAHVDKDTVLAEWTGRTEKSERTFLRRMEELEGWDLAYHVVVDGVYRHKRYPSPTNYVLTEKGRETYRRLVEDAPPVTYEGAYGPYSSPEAWWGIRAAARLIAGQTEANPRFRYLVADVADDGQLAELARIVEEDTDPGCKAEVRRRYGGEGPEASVPDLILRMEPKSGGTSVMIAVEYERASYSTGRLKDKVVKNLLHYTDGGFSAVYYVASDRDAAGLISGAIRKVQRDALDGHLNLPDRAFVALFNLYDLLGGGLPTPAFIDRRFINQADGVPATDWPEGVVRPLRFFKYKSRHR